MTATRREIRKSISAYFGEVPHRITFVRTCRTTLVDVEYTDFRSEQEVRAEIRHIVGSQALLSVKRECSEALMQELRQFLSLDRNGRKTLLILMSCFGG